MTLPNRNPSSFSWEYTEPRGVTFPVGPDGFLEYTPPEFNELTMEVTLKFQGKELKGYTNVFEVEKKFAPTQVYLTNCNGDQFPTSVMSLINSGQSREDHAFTPNHDDFDTPTSLFLTAKLHTDYNGKLRQVIAGNDIFGFPGSGWRWQFGPTTPTTSQFFWTPVGGSQPRFSSVPDSWTPPADGTINWFQLEFQVLSNDTVIKHSSSPDGEDWTLDHQDNLGVEYPIIPSTREMWVGASPQPVQGGFTGGIYFVEFKSSENGTKLAHFNAADFAFNDEAGAVAVDVTDKAWTLHGLALIV